MRLLVQLTQLPPNTADWIEINDKAGQSLMDAGDAAGTCRLYAAALEASRGESEFIMGLGWALCRAGKQQEALPWLERAVANAPKNHQQFNKIRNLFAMIRIPSPAPSSTTSTYESNPASFHKFTRI